MQKGLLYSQGRILIPPTSSALILKILNQYHDSPLAGHYGVARNQALVAQCFAWPGLATYVNSYVRSCDACQRNKVVRHAPFGLLRIYCDYQQTDWAGLLPLAEFNYNNSKHSATTLSPFFANYGFHPSMSLLPTSPQSATPAADSYVQQLQQAQVFLQRELLKARRAMETSANRRRRPAPTLLPRHKVWLLRL